MLLYHFLKTHFIVFIVFQIWDLADPDGKGYLDKQVGTWSIIIKCFIDVTYAFLINLKSCFLSVGKLCKIHEYGGPQNPKKIL